MTEVLPVPLPVKLHGRVSDNECNEVLDSASDEELALLAEAVFGESSEEEYMKSSDDDSPRSAVPSEAKNSSEAFAGAVNAIDLPRLEDKNPAAVPKESSIPIKNEVTPANEVVRVPDAGPRVVDQSEAAPAPRSHCVLVAKCLTNSDASSGRIILPRVAVEANLPFVTAYRHYALTVHDKSGRRYDFMIKSWANGNESRRVFVLEQAGEFLRIHKIGVGDTVGICTDENGALIVEANTEAVRHATVSPRYGALALAQPPPGSTTAAAIPLTATASGRCARSAHCTKAAGHPGFCSGPKAAAAASAGGGRIIHHHQQKPSHRRSRFAGMSPSSPPNETDTYHHYNNHNNNTSSAVDDYSSDETAFTLHNTAASTKNDRHGARGRAHRTPLLIAGPVKAEHPLLPTSLHTLAYIPERSYLFKQVTEYDISSNRVILPADDVEDTIPHSEIVDMSTLAVVDESDRWHFPTLRSWHTVANRRGYLLDDLASFLSHRNVAAGDILMLYRDDRSTPPRIEVRQSHGHQSSSSSSSFKAEEWMDKGARNLLVIRRPTAPYAAVSYEEMPLLFHPKEEEGEAEEDVPRPISSGAIAGGVVNGTAAVDVAPGQSHHNHQSVSAPTPVPQQNNLYHYNNNNNKSRSDTATNPINHHHQNNHQNSYRFKSDDARDNDDFPLVPGAMTCNRTGGCTKAPGHQGFCSGHKGFKRRECGGNHPNHHAFSFSSFGNGGANGTFLGRRAFRQQRSSARQPAHSSAAFYEYDEGEWNSDDDEYTPSIYTANGKYVGSAQGGSKKKARRGSETPVHQVPRGGDDPLLSLLSLLDGQ